jgi:hypothetical protein
MAAGVQTVTGVAGKPGISEPVDSRGHSAMKRLSVLTPTRLDVPIPAAACCRQHVEGLPGCSRSWCSRAAAGEFHFRVLRTAPWQDACTIAEAHSQLHRQFVLAACLKAKAMSNVSTGKDLSVVR